MKKRSSVTMHDIAQRLGVSAMTVSRALSGHPDVNEEKRKKIIDLARELRYRPNRWARTLITNKSYLIGFVVPDISQLFFHEIVRGAEEILSPAGYDLVLCHSDRNAERELHEIDMLISRRVDGLIIASEQPADKLDIFSELDGHQTPFVLIDRYFDGLDCPRVRADDQEAGKIATRHLIALGHTRIAHISGPDVSTGRLRRQGFLEAMREAGLPVEESMVVPSDFKSEGGRAAMRRLLDLSPRPTAVYAGNDPLAFGAVTACQQAGLHVPSDISVIGSGDTELTYHPDPFLTTIAWDRRELGRIAGRLLLERLTDKPSGEQPDTVLQPRLVVRRSTAPPAQPQQPA